MQLSTQLHTPVAAADAPGWGGMNAAGGSGYRRMQLGR
jgi:hypothetical protein